MTPSFTELITSISWPSPTFSVRPDGAVHQWR
jgi:hypothetical protein